MRFADQQGEILQLLTFSGIYLRMYKTIAKLDLYDSISLTLLLLNTTRLVLANSVDPDQLASEEANWSGSALFVIKYVNFY